MNDKVGLLIGHCCCASSWDHRSDWLAFQDDPGLNNGLKLGLPSSTALTCALFLGVLLLWKHRPQSKA